MFDPLNSTASVFGGIDPVIETPPWPTTPHQPNSPIPGLRRASTPLPPTPDKGPTPGLYGKDPKIYGQPEAGLISPKDTVGANGTRFERPEPYLRVRITGLDRNRRDILIKFDAQTNLSNFTGTTYRNVSRSYLEFQQFYEAIVLNNPQTILPALPLAQTSAPTDEEDDRLVKIMLQRWITRVCDDPILVSDEDLRSFIESDFGYQPTPRSRRKASSGFSLIRRGVPDEDEDLQRARFELTKLEGQFFETAKAVDKLAIARKSLATVHAEMGNKLINVATTEAHQPLGNAIRKLGRTWHSLADLGQAQAISDSVILGDSLGYQGMNARSAKETLQQRTGVLEEYQAAVKTTISRRRQIERLKASSNIRPERVDEALEEMEEANKYEQILAKRAEGISQNLHKALQTHNRYANDDITTALIEHTRSSIMYERQLLRELEALRSDVANAANKVVLSHTLPKPTIIPPLEDFSRPHMPPIDLAPAPVRPSTPIQPQPSSVQKHRPPLPVTPALTKQEPPLSTSPSPRSYSRNQGALPTSSFAHHPLPSHISPQSPGAGPSSPADQITFAPPPEDEPPLGGRYVEGTKSMFVKSGSSSLPQSPLQTSASTPSIPRTLGPLGDPLTSTGRPVTKSTSSSSIQSAQHMLNGHSPLNSRTDPLASQTMPKHLSSSLRVQPTRPKLDAREAASKLANMF